jgi:single-stranded DNA-binding protein|tara:strand:- start:19 stop:321 length:303 start_codon:yes stop_codon:yes gene_type:complete
MNICTITGYVLGDITVSYENQEPVAEFTLAVYQFRKTKADGSEAEIESRLECEVWSTGAEAFSKIAKPGSKVTVNASAKNDPHNNGNVFFRVNQFDVHGV